MFEMSINDKFFKKMNFSYYKFIGKRLRPVEFALFIKYCLRVKRQVLTTVEGNKFYVDPISDFGIKMQSKNYYEPDMTKAIRKLLTKDDTFIDIGGNEGYFSVIASNSIGEGGSVICFEPQKRLWDVIIKNVELNDCYNVQLMPFGLGSENSSVWMKLYPSLNTGASTLSSNYNFKIRFQKLRDLIYQTKKIGIRKFDDVVKIKSKIKLVKIDVEGFEFEVLKGMRGVLSRGLVDHLLIEIHPLALNRLESSESEVYDFMDSLHYEHHEIVKDLVLFTLKNENLRN